MEGLKMLKTNSKKTKENIQKYIVNHFSPEGYTDTPPEEWHEIATFIIKTFRSEKYHLIEDFKYYKNNELLAFIDWAQGLPSVLDTCYFYNRSAVNDLGDILEETQEERNKHNETDAEQCLTRLIYKVLIMEVNKK
jgi:hypothetical protein